MVSTSHRCSRITSAALTAPSAIRCLSTALACRTRLARASASRRWWPWRSTILAFIWPSSSLASVPGKSVATRGVNREGVTWGPDQVWWLDPRTGELEPWFELGANLDGTHPEDRGLLAIEPIESSESYSDMADFAEGVSDVRARDLLLRAIAGRGAFRRFKDTLF